MLRNMSIWKLKMFNPVLPSLIFESGDSVAAIFCCLDGACSLSRLTAAARGVSGFCSCHPKCSSLDLLLSAGCLCEASYARLSTGSLPIDAEADVESRLRPRLCIFNMIPSDAAVTSLFNTS